MEFNEIKGINYEILVIRLQHSKIMDFFVDDVQQEHERNPAPPVPNH